MALELDLYTIAQNKNIFTKVYMVFSRKKNYLLIYISELPLSSSTWSNEQEIRHYHHNSFESYPILLLDFSSNLDEVQYQTNHNRPPKLPVSKRQLGYPQQPQVVCNSTLEKKAKVSCWRTATTTKSCGNTTVRGSSKKQPHHDFSENFKRFRLQKNSWNENMQSDGIFICPGLFEIFWVFFLNKF